MAGLCYKFHHRVLPSGFDGPIMLQVRLPKSRHKADCYVARAVRRAGKLGGSKLQPGRDMNPFSKNNSWGTRELIPCHGLQLRWRIVKGKQSRARHLALMIHSPFMWDLKLSEVGPLYPPNLSLFFVFGLCWFLSPLSLSLP